MREREKERARKRERERERERETIAMKRDRASQQSLHGTAHLRNVPHPNDFVVTGAVQPVVVDEQTVHHVGVAWPWARVCTRTRT